MYAAGGGFVVEGRLKEELGRRRDRSDAFDFNAFPHHVFDKAVPFKHSELFPSDTRRSGGV